MGAGRRRGDHLAWGRGDTQTQYPKAAIGAYPAECSYGINLSIQAYIH